MTGDSMKIRLSLKIYTFLNHNMHEDIPESFINKRKTMMEKIAKSYRTLFRSKNLSFVRAI